MPIFDLFSKQRRKERGELPDVFVYDQIPHTLRVQIVHIWRDAIGKPDVYGTPAHDAHNAVIEILCREYGLFKLAEGELPEQILANFLLREQNVDHVLDVIQYSFRAIEVYGNDREHRLNARTTLMPDAAIEELNERFLEHAVGYQYVSGQIIKQDSQFLHAEVVKPVLALLQDKRYKGANEEFLSAHEHYRKDQTKDCLVDCLKALESTLKTICSIRGWSFTPKDTASTLLDICFKEGLVDSFLQSHYSALRSMLESGVPPLRNKLGGHGQGTQIVNVPSYYAAYALHMTGSAIQFLIEAEKNR